MGSLNVHFWGRVSGLRAYRALSPFCKRAVVYEGTETASKPASVRCPGPRKLEGLGR